MLGRASCLVLSATLLSCATTPCAECDAREALRRMERSLLETPGLDVEIRSDHPKFTFSRFRQDGLESREIRSQGFRLKRGAAYWAVEYERGDPREFSFGDTGSFDSRGSEGGGNPPGRMLLEILYPWGLAAPFLREAPEEHILSASLLTTSLADVRFDRDADGPFLVCRFTVGMTAYVLAKEYWDQTVIGGIEMGPPRPLSGMTEQKLWYDPKSFIIRKRTITGEFSVDGGRPHVIAPVTEVYRPSARGANK